MAKGRDLVFSCSINIIGFNIFLDYLSRFAKNKEEITINSFEPSPSSKILFDHSLKKKQITLEFGILLSNTSDNTISLIDHRLEQTTPFPLQKVLIILMTTVVWTMVFRS
ncbi:hypothetical protein F6Y03_00920 [Bacillus megaterium]|nr:hypothetical protein [Priestia megaterium]